MNQWNLPHSSATRERASQMHRCRRKISNDSGGSKFIKEGPRTRSRLKRKVFKRLWPGVTPTDAHFIRSGRGIVSEGRARHVRKGTDSGKRRRDGEEIAMEGKRSHDFLGRERLPNSREHGVTLFQNAARPSVAAAARILASFHAISSFSSPPSPFPLSPGGERERVGRGKGGGNLVSFFSWTFRRSTIDQGPQGRKDTSYPGRKRPERVFSVRIRKARLKTSNCESISLLLPPTVPKGSLGERKKYRQPPSSTTDLSVFWASFNG